MTMIKLRSALAAVACTALLVACGGGGDGADNANPKGPVAVDMVPISATVSATAYTQFASTLSNSDQAQPLGMDALTPPTSERDAPLALN
jgi:hypothetical protein